MKLHDLVLPLKECGDTIKACRLEYKINISFNKGDVTCADGARFVSLQALRLREKAVTLPSQSNTNIA